MHEDFAQSFEMTSLHTKKAERFNDVLDIDDRCPSHFLWRSILFKESRRYRVDPLVSALRAKNCGNEQLKWSFKIEFTANIGIAFGEDLVHRHGLTGALQLRHRLKISLDTYLL